MRSRKSSYGVVEKDGKNTFSVTFSKKWWGHIISMGCTLDKYLEEHAGDLTRHLRLFQKHRFMSVILTDTDFDKRQASFEVQGTEYVKPCCDDEYVLSSREHSHPVAGQDPRYRQSPPLPASPPLVIMTEESSMSAVERLVEELNSYLFTAEQLERVGKQKSEPCLQESSRAQLFNVERLQWVENLESELCLQEPPRAQSCPLPTSIKPIAGSSQSFFRPGNPATTSEISRCSSVTDCDADVRCSAASSADAASLAGETHAYSFKPIDSDPQGRLSPYYSPRRQPNLWREKLYKRRYGLTKPEPKNLSTTNPLAPASPGL